MIRVKPAFIAVAAMVILAATAMVGWFAWRRSVAWMNAPTSGNNDIAAALRDVTPPPIPEEHQAGAHAANPQDFLGTWTGKWDGIYPASFTITRTNRPAFAVSYEVEESPGQITRKTLHPVPSGRVLRMPRASIVLTLSDTQPNTARADGSFDLGGSYQHRINLTRTIPQAAMNWFPDSNPAGPFVLDIKASIDGGDVLHLSPTGATWQHKDYQWPTDVTINGIDWDVQSQPTMAKTGLEQLDFASAAVANRDGRDLVALDHTDKGVDIYFDDSPAGAAPYEIVIRFQRASGQPSATTVPSDLIPLNIDADIDGSDTLKISPKGVFWRHDSGDWPANVTLDGEPWDVQKNPRLADAGLTGADLSSAQMLRRSGRDVLAMEKNGIVTTIYFYDMPDGAVHYHATIGFRRK